MMTHHGNLISREARLHIMCKKVEKMWVVSSSGHATKHKLDDDMFLDGVNKNVDWNSR